MINIREITENDAEAHLKLCLQLDLESKFMLYEPGERSTAIDAHKEFILPLIHSSNSTIILAEHNNRLVGHLTVVGGEARRTSHLGYLVIGILKDYTGKGIGTRLFNFLEDWRTNRNIKKFELTVMSHNEAALALYKKMGFVIEGIKKKSMFIDDEFIDEYYMGKTLD